MQEIMTRISGDRNYWLVRAQSGNYHAEFVFGGFIAVGWDEINDLSIVANQEYLEGRVQKEYPSSQHFRLIANQIRRFVIEMKPGDIVIVPSDSGYISFGEISGGAYIETIDDDIEEGVCPFVKRRPVNWKKILEKERLDPYLFKLLFSHHAISNANEYSGFIDRTLHSFYEKSGVGHLVLRVTKPGKIYASQLARIISDVIEIGEYYRAESGASFPIDDIEIKIDVQSPGLIEFIGVSSAVIILGVLLAIVTTATAGGKLNIDLKNGVIGLETEGLLRRIAEMKGGDIKNRLEALGVKLPEELTKEEGQSNDATGPNSPQV